MVVPALVLVMAMLGKGISAQICVNPCVKPNTLPSVSPILPRTTRLVPGKPVTMVDSAIVQSLVETLQMFIVSDLLESTLNEPDFISPKILAAPQLKTQILPPVAVAPSCKPTITKNMIPDFTFLPFEYPSLDPSPCGCKKPLSSCNRELILPPSSLQLPCGLGYFPSVAPMVASAFGAVETFGPVLEALIPGAPAASPITCGSGLYSPCPGLMPVPAPCTSAVIAAPLCPEIAAMARPIIL